MTNNVSLLHVIEQLRYRESAESVEEQIQAAGAAGFSVDMELVSYWVRSDFDVPESAATRIHLVLPSGENISVVQEVPVRLETQSGYRLRFGISGIPFHGFGVYWFRVEGRVGDDWEFKTKLPLHIHRLENEDGEVVPTE